MRLGVDLDHLAVLRRGLEHFVEVDLVAVAAEEQPAGGVAEHRHVRIRQSPADALRLLLFGQVEMAVDAGHHVVEAGQQLVVEIERAVGQDVALGAL